MLSVLSVGSAASNGPTLTSTLMTSSVYVFPFSPCLSDAAVVNLISCADVKLWFSRVHSRLGEPYGKLCLDTSSSCSAIFTGQKHGLKSDP